MRPTLSIILIFQILLGSINFNGEMHFCGNNLKDIALFGKAESCGSMGGDEENKTCSVGFHQDGFNKDNCCKDRKFSILGISSGYDLANGFSFSISKNLSAVFFFQDEIFNGLSPFSNASFYIDRYEPPIIFRDIPTLFDSFLI